MAVGIIADAEDFRLCGIVDVKRKIVTGHNPVEQGEDTPDDNLRLFPMPTYDISDETHTKVTVHGELIDENYTDILNNNPDLPLEDVIALDKVQKKMLLNEMEIQRLRDLKLVKGRATSLQIVGNEKSAHLSNSDLKQKILDLIKGQGFASREDIENLILPFLPQDLPITKRQKKISNLILDLSNREKVIKNSSSSDKFAIWVIVK